MTKCGGPSGLADGCGMQPWPSANNSIETIKDGKADKPSVTFIALCKLYMQLKRKLPWLRELPADTTLYALP